MRHQVARARQNAGTMLKRDSRITEQGFSVCLLHVATLYWPQLRAQWLGTEWSGRWKLGVVGIQRIEASSYAHTAVIGGDITLSLWTKTWARDEEHHIKLYKLNLWLPACDHWFPAIYHLLDALPRHRHNMTTAIASPNCTEPICPMKAYSELTHKGPCGGRKRSKMRPLSVMNPRCLLSA